MKSYNIFVQAPGLTGSLEHRATHMFDSMNLRNSVVNYIEEMYELTYKRFKGCRITVVPVNFNHLQDTAYSFILEVEDTPRISLK